MSPGEVCAQTAYAKTYHLKPESAFKKFYLDFKSDQFNLNADTNYMISSNPTRTWVLFRETPIPTDAG